MKGTKFSNHAECVYVGNIPILLSELNLHKALLIRNKTTEFQRAVLEFAFFCKCTIGFSENAFVKGRAKI